jgi:hypothetical protein
VRGWEGGVPSVIMGPAAYVFVRPSMCGCVCMRTHTCTHVQKFLTACLHTLTVTDTHGGGGVRGGRSRSA